MGLIPKRKAKKSAKIKKADFEKVQVLIDRQDRVSKYNFPQFLAEVDEMAAKFGVERKTGPYARDTYKTMRGYKSASRALHAMKGMVNGQ